jgi:hypothetical protein
MNERSEWEVATTGVPNLRTMQTYKSGATPGAPQNHPRVRRLHGHPLHNAVGIWTKLERVRLGHTIVSTTLHSKSRFLVNLWG